jgi:protein-L-isoaspartate(D-aspartate) O-methyltransferase
MTARDRLPDPQRLPARYLIGRPNANGAAACSRAGAGLRAKILIRCIQPAPHARMDFEQARFNMVEQQVRTWDVLDPAVLDLLGTLPRENFVPEDRRSLAFADLELPIGHGEVMLAPKMQARIAQEVMLTPSDRVLEVGTGTGYLTAMLARLAGSGSVTSVEIHPDLAQGARARLSALGIDNVKVEVGDAARGWAFGGPFDVIVLTGSLPMLPDAFQKQLKRGGRLFAIVGERPVMTARLIVRESDTAFGAVTLFETVVDPLRNAQQPKRFVF